MISALMMAGMLSLSAFVPAKPGQRPPPAPPVAGLVNLNTATAKQLALLPGVGPHRAKAIVAYREKTHFEQPGQVRDVKGVGAGVYAKMKSHLAVSGPNTLHRIDKPAK
jgi:competence ComEA-like helix-hairpin-helix protein